MCPGRPGPPGLPVPIRFSARELKTEKIEETSANPTVFAKSPYLQPFSRYRSRELSTFDFTTKVGREGGRGRLIRLQQED